jgi:glycosyltransferase involved in cell wall biosynthesis
MFVYALLILYYWQGWKSLKEFTATEANKNVFISVVIAARNEEKNIAALLTALKHQTYSPNFFEVIIVDDFSTDATGKIVSEFSSTNIHLIQPEINADLSSKKKAIEAGIKKAKGELIVTTDADCIPKEGWLQTFNDFHTQTNASFTAAPVKFFYNKSLLQIFQSIDFLTLQGITAASVASNFHTMCNGANLAYKKQSFTDVNGFEGIDKIATGDDMLLMHKIWKKDQQKVFYLKSKEAIVATEPMQSWKDFIMQRKRWASKTFVYNDYRIIAVLFFVYLLNCLFIALIVSSFFNSFYWWYVAGFWIGKTIIEAPFVYSVSKFYDEQKLMRYFFFFQPLHIFYTVFVGLISQFGKYEWKGRRTK